MTVPNHLQSCLLKFCFDPLEFAICAAKLSLHEVYLALPVADACHLQIAYFWCLSNFYWLVNWGYIWICDRFQAYTFPCANLRPTTPESLSFLYAICWIFCGSQLTRLESTTTKYLYLNYAMNAIHYSLPIGNLDMVLIHFDLWHISIYRRTTFIFCQAADSFVTHFQTLNQVQFFLLVNFLNW